MRVVNSDDMTMIKKLIPLTAIGILLTGCSSTLTPSGNVSSLEGLQAMHSIGDIRSGSTNAVGQIRYMAIRETALSVGARAGLAWRSNQIDDILSSDESVLNQAYNFYGLMLPDNVLPPVLQEAQDTLNLADPNTIRLSSKVYRIKSQARFVTAPPTWRDYLWMDYAEPQRPDNSLLPKNKAEQTIWNKNVAKGWENGINQAANIFAANLARLNGDYKGMVLYRKLYQENMVSAPYVAKTDLGITGNGNSMSIDDRVLRITALPQLNLRDKTWKPILVPDPLAAYKLNLLKQIYPKSIPSNMKAKLFIK